MTINDKIDDYSIVASQIINDNKNYDVDLLFYLTRFCNLACEGCYMRSNTGVPRNVLPSSDIEFYLKEFAKIPRFTKSVVFSGGEIFSTPIEYLEKNAALVLDCGYQLQLKTNGAWVNNSELAPRVLNMLRKLNPQFGVCASYEDIEDCLRQIPKPLRRIFGRAVAFKKFPLLSSLNMVVSVDDRLHPAQSADWFLRIVDIVSRDKKLRKNLDLKTFSFDDCVDFFQQRILENPKMPAKNFRQRDDLWLATYTINGKRIESYFGKFVETAKIPMLQNLYEFTLPPIDKMAKGRLVYCFYPDRTVAFDCNYLETVGRVSYVRGDGTLKTFDEIREGIHKKLVADYARELSK